MSTRPRGRCTFRETKRCQPIPSSDPRGRSVNYEGTASGGVYPRRAEPHRRDQPGGSQRITFATCTCNKLQTIHLYATFRVLHFARGGIFERVQQLVNPEGFEKDGAKSF